VSAGPAPLGHQGQHGKTYFWKPVIMSLRPAQKVPLNIFCPETLSKL